MITKSNITEHILNAVFYLATGSVTISIFTGFDKFHALIGVGGQLLYIITQYLRSINLDKPIKQRPWLYWLAAILLGAAVSYLGTGYVSEKIGVSEMIVSVSLGFFAQSLPDLADLAKSLFFDFLKKKYGNE